MGRMTVSVMITTRNRCSELRQTLEMLEKLNPQPIEILVCADGCTDGTDSMLANEFQGLHIISNLEARGSIAARIQLLHLAKGDIVLSLDDDSYPTAPDFLSQLIDQFEKHPEVSVISAAELRDGGQFSSPTKTPDAQGQYVSAYANCAGAMKRSFYLERQGFLPFFFHMYEEPDYALQCYAAGSAVWFEPSLVIRHHLSASQRQNLKRHHQNARNELWSVWIRCPWPWMPLVAAFRILTQFRYAWSQGVSWTITEPLWWYAALRGLPKCLKFRAPVNWGIYLNWMRLARNPILTVDELSRKFNHPSI